MRDKTVEFQELQRRFDRQRRVIEATQTLHSSLDLDEVLELILKAAAGGVRAERGTVFLLSQDGETLWSRVLSGKEHVEIRLPLGQGIAGTVARTGQAVRIPDAWEDPRFDRSWDERSSYRTRQVICAPIRSREGKIIGVFQLLNKPEGEFTVEDEEFLAALSLHAALAVENARLHKGALENERRAREMRLALDVQRQLQPERRSVRVGSLKAAGLNELCEDASGDYYDLLPSLPGGRLGVAIGDVTGHGLQAALLMAETRALLRAALHTVDEPSAVLTLLNDFLVPDMLGGRFVSLFTAKIDPLTGRTDWCNGGHPPPLHYCAASGEIRELKPTGPALGLMEDASFKPGEPTVLEPGDVLLAYTDGATEARTPGKDFYGEERLTALLGEKVDDEPEEIIEAIRDSVRDFTGARRREDDLTLLVVKRLVSRSLFA